MVSPEVIAAARQLAPRRILVTGGSGFVGSRLAMALSAGGHDVVTTGRNPYRVPFPPDGNILLQNEANGCILAAHWTEVMTVRY